MGGMPGMGRGGMPGMMGRGGMPPGMGRGGMPPGMGGMGGPPPQGPPPSQETDAADLGW